MSLGLSANCTAVVLSLTSSTPCAHQLENVLYPTPFPFNTNYSGCTWSGSCLIGAPSYTYGQCALCDAPDACRAAIEGAIAADAAGCANAADALGLALIRDQGSAVCAAGLAREVAGSASFGGLSQCSGCGVVVCPQGWLCAPDAPPATCPGGFSCLPGASAAVACPVGSFCAEGDALAPVACRPAAFGSCGGQASREVIWLPLLLALLAIVCVQAATLVFERRRIRRIAAAAAVSQAAPAHAASGSLPLVLSLALHAKDADRSENEAPVPSPTTAAGVGSLAVSFTGLELVTRGVRRLDKVSGSLAPARVTAIMGGSGAGKTTLLNALLGKDTPTAGTVRAMVMARDGSATVLAPDQLRMALGFVPQTDLLHDDISVQEAVTHAAATRLPHGVRGDDLDARVDRALDALSLTHCAHTLAGALSASNRKRLSIAIELVSEPLLLVLDEPTTGLDASSALGVVETVRAAASRRGLTVCAVLHQPRPEIFALVDELVLLARGGRPVFLGPRALVEVYFFKMLGYSPASDTAPADFVMDVVNAVHGCPPCSPKGKGTGGSRDPVTVAESLAAEWRDRGEAWVAAQRASIAGSSGDGSSSSEHRSDGGSASSSGAAWVPRPRRMFMEQAYLYFVRAFRQRLRGGSTVGTLVSFLLGGCVTGLVFSGGPLYIPPPASSYYSSCPTDGLTFCVNPQSSMYQPGPFYVAMIVGALSIPPAVRSFGGEREQAWREAGVGAVRSAYFVGVAVADLLCVWLLSALAYIGPMLAIAQLRGSEANYYALALAIMYMCSSLAWAISAAMGVGTDKATLTGVVLAVVLNLFGGFVPMVGSYGAWCYAHWAQRAFATNELIVGFRLSTHFYEALTPTEWAHPDFASDIGYLALTATATAALALVLTLQCHRDHQR